VRQAMARSRGCRRSFVLGLSIAAACGLTATASANPPMRNGPIAFDGAPHRGDDFQIFIMNAHGSNLRQITHTKKEPQYPSLADNGKLAFQEISQIFVMNSNGSDERQLTHNTSAAGAGDPSFSPDGSGSCLWAGSAQRVTRSSS
jgi:hypothetical protein